MARRLLSSGLIALAMTAATTASTSAQPFTEAATDRAAGGAIARANALSARIRSYHRWTGLTPLPASYCPTMREGEAVLKELAGLSSRATLYRQPGFALNLQQAGDRLSDALDEEEEVNAQAGIPYAIYPCPVPPGIYPARATVLRIVAPRMPVWRQDADALRLSFGARRTMMLQCLRVPGM